MSSSFAKSVTTIRDYGLAIKNQVFSPPRGLLKHSFLQAGVTSYPVLVDWDAVWSGFFYLGEGDPAPLRDSLLNFLDHIGPDGKGQRRIDIERYSAMPYQIRPFLATGAWVLSREIGTDWLDESALTKLQNYLGYWHRERLGRHGLLTWLHVDEGFADNGLQNWSWESCAVEAVDLNCQLVREHLALARILEAANDPAGAARERQYARILAERVEAALWQEEFGGYAGLYSPPRRFDPSEPILVHGYSNLWPLWIGITPPERARRVIETLLLSEEQFMSPFGIRTLAKSDRCFNNMEHGYSNPMQGSPQLGPVYSSNCSNWQGPVWALPNLMALDILSHYGYKAEAEALAEKVVGFFAMALERDGCFHENYHSETGEPLCAPGIVSWSLCFAHAHKHLASPRFADLVQDALLKP